MVKMRKLVQKFENPFFRNEILEVIELLELIEALKIMGVIGASVMYSFFGSRTQPLQMMCQFGLECLGPEDPSRMCAEELPPGDALKRTKRVLLDVTSVPYVPKLYSSKNQPIEVSIHLARVIILIL
jgi:hypothetical protein